jgi:UDP-N-acetylmuramate dehydrogenase
MSKLRSQIEAIPDCELLPGVNLGKYTTFKLHSLGDLLEVRTIDALTRILPLLNENDQDYVILGWGANQIFPEQCGQLVIHLDFPFDLNYFNQPRTEYELPASLGLNHLTAHGVKFGLSGWEVFTGIPASLGGAIFMNAGTNLGEIGKLIKKVRLMSPDGVIREEVIGKDSFSYRKNHFVKKGEVIVDATMIHLGLNPDISLKIKDYLAYRKLTQPLSTKNCGCVFKNPLKDVSAGMLIDLLQLKGVSCGGLRISPRHANFMENFDQASWDQLRALVELVQFEVDHFYGLEFELEVKIPYD